MEDGIKHIYVTDLKSILLIGSKLFRYLSWYTNNISIEEFRNDLKISAETDEIYCKELFLILQKDLSVFLSKCDELRLELLTIAVFKRGNKWVRGNG